MEVIAFRPPPPPPPTFLTQAFGVINPAAHTFWHSFSFFMFLPFKTLFNFPFFFLFDPWVVWKCVISFSSAWQCPRDLSVIDTVSNLIPPWSEDILRMTCIPLNIRILVLWPRMWSIFINVPCTLERNVSLQLLDGLFYKCQLCQVGGQCWSRPLDPYWFSAHLLYQLLKREDWNTQL